MGEIIKALVWLLVISIMGLSERLLAEEADAQGSQLYLENTIKGNTEQPSVLFILPWQRVQEFAVDDRQILQNERADWLKTIERHDVLNTMTLDQQR